MVSILVWISALGGAVLVGEGVQQGSYALAACGVLLIYCTGVYLGRQTVKH